MRKVRIRKQLGAGLWPRHALTKGRLRFPRWGRGDDYCSEDIYSGVNILQDRKQNVQP